MKVSKRIYKVKQNQATGALLVAILSLLILLFHAYKIFFKGEPFDLIEWIGWIVILPVMLLIWRRREKKFKELKIDD